MNADPSSPRAAGGDGHGIRRVLMAADTVGGVWTYAVELARGLTAHGIEVRLATMGAPLQPAQRAAVTALRPRLSVSESTYRLEWMQDPWADVAAAGAWLQELEAEFQPDVVHVNGYAHAAVPGPAPRMLVAHSCVFSWWQAVHGTSPPPEWARYRAAVRAGLDAADLVVAPSHAMLDALRFHYGPLRRTAVIHNGRTLTTTAEPAAVERQPEILCVGRLWDAAKNAAALADLAPVLPWPVRIAGETRSPDGNAITLPNVELLGVRAPAELAADYRRASIYALPARYEPFGLSVLEAAQAGCALVLGDIPSLRELWSGAAVFVPPHDRSGLHRALTDLIRDPARRETLAQAARQRAGRYPAERMLAAYLTAYSDLLPSPHLPAEPLAASLA